MKLKKNYFLISLLIIVTVGLFLSIYILREKQSDKTVVFIVNNTPISKVCYDYYYYSYYNSYINNYSFIMDYMDVDTSKDIMDQKYDDDRTFREYFEDCTKEQIVKVLALSDDARRINFVYDAPKEYDEYIETVSESLKGSKYSVDDYLKNYFGENATKKKLEAVMVEGYYANAYYNYLLSNEVSKYPDDMEQEEKTTKAINEVATYVNGLKEKYEVIYW